MTLFYLRTVLFYLFEHAYVFFRLKSRTGNKPVFWLALPWFLCMSLYPLLFLYLPSEELSLRWLDPVLRLWLPLVYVCFIALLMMDLGRVAAWAGKQLFPGLSFPARTRRLCAASLLAILALIYAYGVYEAHTLGVTRLVFPTSKLPAGSQGFRIAFVADLHIGPQTGTDMLRVMVDRVLAEKPDCILVGGDVLDDALQGTKADLAQLARLRAPYGQFAVLGNHDAFGPWEKAAEFLERAGITMLAGQAAEAGPVTIVGVDDPLVSSQKNRATDDPLPLLEGVDPSRYTILLEHQPIRHDKAAGLMDVQLSGHTHGGQTIFLKLFMRLMGQQPEGLISLGENEEQSVLYITRGVGFSKLPIRLLTPPEVVIIDLTPAAGP